MLRLIDNIWFWFKNHAKGYEAGFADGYANGDLDGRYIQHHLIIAELKKKNLDSFKDASLVLGYNQAQAVIEEMS